MDNTLQQIHHCLADDLNRLNRAVESALRSDSELLNAIVAYYLKSKGKQLRPLLVLLAARLVGEVNALAIDGAVSIELLHNATLIHDDVVDESPLRRGRATVNSVWDNKAAVLAGDFFVSCALSSALNTQHLPIISVLATLGKELSTGEINQLNVAQDKQLSEERYLRVIAEKTASLFVACFKVGGLSAAATPTQLEAMESAAYKMGLCFQIKDDLLDYGVGEELVGKPLGADIREGKFTLPLIYAATHPTCEGHARVTELIQLSEFTPSEVEELRQLAHLSGGIAYAEATMRQLQQEVTAHLAPFSTSPVHPLLIDLMTYIIDRNH